MKAPKPNNNSSLPPSPPLPSTSSQKQKLLSIHIATDHIGPSKMPLVYGSTPERVGAIRGTVRFSTNYPCKGKDIVIMYEAKAEAQWSALENKKVVRHQTEEILGYHIWHFPLEHTKTGGSTVAVGVYEKEFEIPLVHPSSTAAAAISSSSSLRYNNTNNSNPSSSPSSPPASSSAGFAAAAPSKINSAPVPHTTTITGMVGAKPVGPVSASAAAAGLLPSSSYSPQARIKYTIRAILQRPFPSITHVEASQEVWVLNSSLPPQFPLPTSLSPSNSTTRRSHSNASSKNRRRSAKTSTTPAATTTTTTATTTTNPTSSEKAADKESSKSPDNNEILKSQPLVSLPLPSQVFKSALAMLPTIDLSRSKQLFSISKPGSTSASTSESASGPGLVTTSATSSPQPSTPVTTATPTTTVTAATSSATTTTVTKNSTDTTSEAGSSSSCSSVSSPRLNSHDSNYHAYHTEDADNENIADYTGVWEAFDIPYSLSLPSEMVYLGQVVPLTIRFGPHRGYCSSRKNKQQEQGNRGHQDTPSRRFVVKKGVLRLVEHTLLREVTTAQVPTPKPASAQNKHHNKSLAMMTTNVHASSQATLEQAFEDDGSTKDSAHRRAFSEQQPHPNNNNNGKFKRMVPLFGKRQDQNAIYQEQGYHGSHSHLPLPGGGDSGVAQRQERNIKAQHQQQLSLPGGGDAQSSLHKHEGDLRRSFFKPNRHSMDVSTGRPVSMVNPYGPTNSSNPRIVSSIEAKFKTEVMLLSLTPFLQRQEQWYQRQIKKIAAAAAGDNDVVQQENNNDGDDDEERGDMYVEEEDVEEDIEDGVWQTTIWVPIPGPSAMATFTETKNIVKTHTLQLILLCGLGEEVKPASAPMPAVVIQSEVEADSGSNSAAGSVSAASLSKVNKEFRLEMDLHVTSPRSPVEMTIRHL
ncbi:hypothetical protein BG015_004449 [Linnemannia schmuckeri]|uniref:Uncharacterized protein n=1 Tax=Linnemannia schmuckeri TaxID=64567 RepID=A0A9P5VF16_9FUNG|nr:hypothetical protein BG015_004449 [Linnemannia schmuckeri]